MKLMARVIRNRQSSLYAPSELKSASHDTFTKAEADVPVCSTQSLAKISNPDIIPSIALLFCARGPFAVVWSVTIVVIDAFKRHLGGWSGSHISQEVFEIQPSIANANTSPSVLSERFISWIFTTLDHCIPNFIFTSPESNGVMSVFVPKLIADAAAATSSSDHQALRTYGSDIAADATASPQKQFSAWVSCSSQHNQSAECAPSQVGGVAVQCYSVVSHAASSQVGVVSVRSPGSLSAISGFASYYPTQHGATI